jgi:putative ABC transport system permease protein
MLTDIRFALRMLIKSPAFSIIAIITLALGIGANSAIFSVINAVLLRPLPFSQPEQLAAIWASSPQRPGNQHEVHSYLDYVDLREKNHTLASMTAYTGASSILGEGDDAADVSGLAATSDIFDVLKTQPFLGRGFNRDDDKAGAAARVVVLGYQLWQKHFAGDPKIIGREINFGARSYTVTGVMPRAWKFPVQRQSVDYIMPLVPLLTTAMPPEMMRRGAHFLTVVGRLKAGVDFRQATADLQTIAAQLAQQYPDADAGRSEFVTPLRDDVVGEVRPALLVLLTAVGLVLLIACANVANLLLARAATREREVAIRTALGASRVQIVRQLLAETFLLSIVGGAAGLLLAWWSIDALVAFGPRELPRAGEITVNAGVVAFTFAISVLTSIAFGLVPALHASRPSVSNSLKDAARGSSGGVHGNRLRSIFVVSQFALSLILLVGAGLLIRSFAHLRAVQPGFNPDRALTVWQSLSKTRYPNPEQQVQFFDRLLLKLAGLPGIEAVGAVSPLPFSGDNRGSTFTVVGQPAPQAGLEPDASHLLIDSGYFHAMQIPLKSGRTFDARDQASSKPVVMVNEAFVKKFFPNHNAIGQNIIVGASPDNPKPAREIVGVVGTSRHDTLTAEGDPELYIPYAQEPNRYMDIVLRTSLTNDTNLDSMIRRAVHEVDPQNYVPKPTPLRDLLSQTLAQPRFNMALLGVFAGVAVILAAVGIYGVIAYSVSQRTKEIGIRMALGAQRADMLNMILRQSLWMVSIGIAVGLAGALAATRLMAALLFGVGAGDISTYTGVIVLLGGAALVASFIPARRAMKIDPMVALRYE